MRIHGTIEDARTEKLLPRAIVTLSIGETNVIENTPARDGSFDYDVPDSALSPDTETLVCIASKKGYKTQTAEYNIIGDEMEINLELIPDPIDWKRIIRIAAIVLGILLLLAIIGVSLYLYFTRPAPVPPTITKFQATPQTISPGDEVNLVWEAVNAERVFLDDKRVEANGFETVKPQVTTQYTLSVKDDEDQPLEKKREVLVLPPPKILNFTATPAELPLWDTAVIEWQTENAEALYIKEGEEDKYATADAIETANGNMKSKESKKDTKSSEGEASTTPAKDPNLGEENDLNGSIEVTPLETTTYTMVAVNRLGIKDVKKLKLKVLVPPEINSFTTTAPVVMMGDSAILTWNTEGAAQAFINDEKTGPNFSMEVTPLETTTYTLRVRNKVGERQCNVIVRVLCPDQEETKTAKKEPKPLPPPPVINRFLTTPPLIASGQRAVLHWVTEHAETVYINDKRVDPLGDLEVFPEVTTKYELKAVNRKDSVTWIRQIEVLPDSCTVILYEFENYTGDYMMFTTDAPEIGKLNNRVSSIKIIGACGVKVFSAPHFNATVQEFTESIPRLRGTWIGNNTISSLMIVKR